MKPAWIDAFQAVYRPLLGEGYDAFEAALAERPGKFFKLTGSRAVNYHPDIAEGCAYTPVEGIPGAFRVDAGYETLPLSISHQTGGMYIMNPSSLVPVMELIRHLPPHPLVLDVAAAPGGKTAAISDYLERRGLVVANEMSPKRLKSLNFNLERCGAWNVKTVCSDGRMLNRYFKNCFDGILLDAPCSNENKIFRHEDVQKQWGQDLVNRMAELQCQLMDSAFDCLAPGGVIAYSTCTFAMEENEGVVRHILSARDDAELIDANGGKWDKGLSGISDLDDKVIRVFPHTSGFDGFFIAVIRKKGEPQDRASEKAPATRLQKKQLALLEPFFAELPEAFQLGQDPRHLTLEAVHPRLTTGRFQRHGLVTLNSAGREPELSAQAAWEFSRLLKKDIFTPVSKDASHQYLKGFDIEKPDSYHGQIIHWENIPVGTVKLVGETLKNKLDRYFLYGKSIVW